MLVGLHVPTNFQIYRLTLTLSKCMCMRARGASELRKFWHFYILKLLFLSIFCRYIRYFVGIQMTCLLAHMYRQISKCTDKTPKKHYWGGGAVAPPPPLATLMTDILSIQPMSCMHAVLAFGNACRDYHLGKLAHYTVAISPLFRGQAIVMHIVYMISN